MSLSTFTIAATTSRVSAAPPVTAGSAVYVVKPGDFLAGIAAKVGVALPELLTANNMTAKSLILPGDQLVLPADAIVAAPAPAAAPAPPAASALTHTVKAGDFLAGIASTYKVTLPELLAVNNMTAKSVILPGAQLALPAAAVAPNAQTVAAAPAAPAPAPSGPGYTVKNGDFLAGIAAKYKVKLADLLAVNKLKASSLILPGLKLTLPAGAVAPAAALAPPESTIGPAGTVVAFAYAQLGKPYRFFTAGPSTFDCSGLTKAAYAQIGIELVHHSASQAGYGTAVDPWSEPIKAGDLVFMATHGSAEINHVGIAVDATHWIHAPKPGDVVRLAPIPAKGLLSTVRRLIP